MELKDFVSQSLIQLVEAVKIAQDECLKYDAVISPVIEVPNREHQASIGLYNKQPTFLLDFDIAVSVNEETGNKSGFGLFVAAFTGGVQASSESANTKLSRIKFSIPISYPTRYRPIKEG